jgi:hypothetical protein
MSNQSEIEKIIDDLWGYYQSSGKFIRNTFVDYLKRELPKYVIPKIDYDKIKSNLKYFFQTTGKLDGTSGEKADKILKALNITKE